MNMSTFSRLTGLSAHTLRYYEKIGLLKMISRNSSGHRVYTEKEQRWVEIIIHLKETGMPLDNIIEYARLIDRGDETLEKRRKMLRQHRLELKQRLEKQHHHLEALDRKIKFYSNKINA